MKITNIDINNMLGIKSAEFEISKPALLVAGANGAGKSSIAEAIRHAIAAKWERVEHKKDFGALLNSGASAGHAIIGTSLGEYGVLLPDGKQTGDTTALPFGLDYCLDPTLFARATANERRTFLLKLMGVKITAATIIEKLAERGADNNAIAQIKPHLASGFEAAHKEAQALARDEKAAWRAITGETYGAVKAEAWQAEKGEPIKDFDIAVAGKKIADADEHIEQLNARIGELNAKLDNAHASNLAAATRLEKIEALREVASTFARVQDKLHRDEKDLADWEIKVKDTEAAATGHQYNEPMSCPHCAGLVVISAHEPMLLEYQEAGKADAEAQQKLPEYIKARDLMQSAVNNGKRDLSAAENAAREINALESEQGNEIIDTDALQAQINECAGLLKGAKTNRDLYRKDAEDINQINRKNAQADAKTEKAAKHHASVKAFDFIADCLAPSGIPSDMLDAALTPFCKYLGELCGLAGWPQIYITNDMDIVMGDHLYALKSESEQWRADAIIALAIAVLSDCNTVILDRFDVLDLAGRSDALSLIENVAIGENTIILLGTLKALPAKLPDSMQAVWLNNGTVESVKVAA